MGYVRGIAMAELEKGKVINGVLLKCACPTCKVGSGYLKPIYLSEVIEAKVTCRTCGLNFMALITPNMEKKTCATCIAL